MDALTLAILLPIAPMALVAVLWVLSRRKQGAGGKGGKDLNILLGFLSITLAVLFLPNPYSIYAGQDVDFEAVMVFSSIAIGFLVVAVFVFKSHRKG